MLPNCQQNTATMIAEALSEEQIRFSNAVATLLTGCVVIRNRDGHSHTVVSVPQISKVRVSKSSRLALLTIAGASFIVAAAALCSKDGAGAEIPAALLGLFFLFAYLGSRRASITIFLGADAIRSVDGKVPEATAVAAALRQL
jgi:hypothetical protein